MKPEEAGGIDPALADEYFREFESVCEKDNGALWGVPLQGPVIFVDMGSRDVVANQADAEGRLTRHGDLFAGTMPPEALVGNTAIEWSGVKWTMLLWQSMSERLEDRIRIMMHEAFHRVQDEIGFPMTSPQNVHLDTLDGRLWLQLEWRALERALRADGDERNEAAEDALVFRAYRRSLFPESAKDERVLEMHEGIAEYTGVKLSGMSRTRLADDVRMAQEKYKTFPRSFAYTSGPAYGLLLDELAGDWRKGLKPEDDLGTVLGGSIGFEMPPDLKGEAERRSERYDLAALRAAEEEREKEREKLIASYREALIDCPVLILPVPHGMGCESNPNEELPISEHETIFPTCRVKAEWGILTVSQGGLLRNRERKAVYVPVPSDPDARPLKGEGWILELKEGWTVVPSERERGFVLKDLRSKIQDC